MTAPWDQLVVWLVGLAAVLYLARQAFNKRKSPGCGGCGTSCATDKPSTATTNLVQIEMSRPPRRASAPPRPTDPSLN